MESFSLLPVTIASILASFSGANGPVEEAFISTHIRPEIAGLWEVELPNPDNDNAFLQATNDTTLSESTPTKSTESHLPQSNYSDPLNQNTVLNRNSTSQNGSNKTSTYASAQPLNSASQLELVLGAIRAANVKVDGNLQGDSQKLDESIAATENTRGVDTNNFKDSINAKECHERYNLGADNKVVTTSGNELTYGEYIYHHQKDGLPLLAISTIYDNNEVDCSGNRIDQTGEAIIAFVDYQSDKNEMRWCADKEGKGCFMTFHRLLP